MNKQDFDLVFEQKQKQVLKPKLIHSMNLLQMSIFDLNNYVEEIIEENPVAEKIEIEAVDSPKNKKRDDFIETIGNDENGVTLYDYVYDQIKSFLINEDDVRIAEYILNSLDKDGYFKENIEQTSIILQCDKNELIKILFLIQECEPCGVATNGLKESLVKQLEKKNDAKIAIKIVQHFLQEFANNRNHIILKSLKIDSAELEKAKNLIRECNPRPANGFKGREKIEYIIPEVMIKKENDSIKAEIKDSNYNKLFINNYYQEYIKQADQETKDYIKEKITQINNVNYFIDRRKESIKRIVGYIVEKQKDYFLTNNQLNIIPLTQKNIANDLNISISTVSRAINNKYLECEEGIFPISYFVQEPIGGQITKIQIFNLIEKIINSEESDTPFSDESIKNKLGVLGVHLSRRTISKYRKELGYSNKNKRKL